MTPNDRRASWGSGEMFGAIAGGYDRLNRIISLGQDQRWRRRTVRALEVLPGTRVLDLATGTADLALQIAKIEPEARIVGLNPSTEMLAVARRKVRAAGLEQVIELVEGNAMSLPFESDSFDRASMAFGIRNVPDRGQALREIARVLRPGGRLAILELSEPTGPLSAAPRLFIRHVMPRIGAFLSGAAEYRYLQRSITAFPPPHEFAKAMIRSGFAKPKIEVLTLGVCVLFCAQIPEPAP